MTGDLFKGLGGMPEELGEEVKVEG